MTISSTPLTATTLRQRTLGAPLALSGIGLHSGKTVHMALQPAPIDSGITFVRTDLADAQPIAAHFTGVRGAQMASNLVNDKNQRVGTVEHLMSALAALGIDNLRVELDAPEIPILDGSAQNFFTAIRPAIVEQSAAKKFIEIIQPVEVRDGDKIARLIPYDGFALDFTIDFAHPAFCAEHATYRFEFTTDNFAKQIAPARTFGFLKDIEALQRQNLTLGGSMDNAIVLDDSRVLNPEGLRFANEFVRHKILDAIGDLYLAGHQILGEFYAYKSGHSLNNRLLQAVFANTANWQIVTKDVKDSQRF